MKKKATRLIVAAVAVLMVLAAAGFVFLYNFTIVRTETGKRQMRNEDEVLTGYVDYAYICYFGYPFMQQAAEQLEFDIGMCLADRADYYMSKYTHGTQIDSKVLLQDRKQMTILFYGTGRTSDGRNEYIHDEITFDISAKAIRSKTKPNNIFKIGTSEAYISDYPQNNYESFVSPDIPFFLSDEKGGVDASSGKKTDIPQTVSVGNTAADAYSISFTSEPVRYTIYKQKKNNPDSREEISQTDNVFSLGENFLDYDYSVEAEYDDYTLSYCFDVKE